MAYSRQAGGAEKSALKLQKGLLLEGLEVHFGTLIQSDKDFYPFVQEFNNHSFFPQLNKYLRKKRKGKHFWTLPLVLVGLMDLRRKIKNEKFDIVISFGAGVGCVSFLSLILSKVPQVTSERINPDPGVYKPSLFARILRPYIYRHGVVCTVQTEGFSQWVRNNWNFSPALTPNHFDIPHRQYVFPQNPSPVVAIGRPAYQKGYDILIESWKIVEKIDSRKLIIVADDSQNYISNLIQASGCENILVRPLTDDLPALFDECSLFISTARFEGYPNAVAEAIIYGIPVLTTVSSDIVELWGQAQICRTINDSSPISVSKSILELLGDDFALHDLNHKAMSSRANFGWNANKRFWFEAISQARQNF
jgi:glycosyltransferase involved in cell wall biosynthesis